MPHEPTPLQELPAVLLVIGAVLWMTVPDIPAMAIATPIAIVMVWLQPVVFSAIDRHFMNAPTSAYSIDEEE